MKSYPVLEATDSIASPGLWVDQSILDRNIRQMILDVGGLDHVGRLRPHVKTHKMREVIERQVKAGITKCKAATPKEAEIAAEGGATDILIAHQLVGPKLEQVAALVERFPQVYFSAIVDHTDGLKMLVEKLGNSKRPFPVRIDVDCGMGRSGIPFGENFDALREQIEAEDRVVFSGLHVYDGHLHAPSFDQREREAKQIIASVRNYMFDHKVPMIVGGGSPTFTIWASHTDWECSPGTTVFWDCGYGENYPDLNYQVAAGVLARVISKPSENRICLDLGHKSIAAEMALENRVFFPELPSAKLIGQSEEHLVIEVENTEALSIGQAFTGIPRHICPTVALHEAATILDAGEPTGETWQVAARGRQI